MKRNAYPTHAQLLLEAKRKMHPTVKRVLAINMLKAGVKPRHIRKHLDMTARQLDRADYHNRYRHASNV